MNETERRKRLRRVYGLLARLATAEDEVAGQGEDQTSPGPAASDAGAKKLVTQRKGARQ